jgi:nicotinate-nucleotide adenylyltransferase
LTEAASDGGRCVAIYGGSFDPPHISHVLAVAWLLSAGPVDEVWVLPVARHPFGKRSVGFDDRLALCRAAFAWMGPRVQVRRDEEGSSGRTLDLLQRLRSEAPADTRFRLVCGTDVIAERDRWHRFADVAALAPPLVLGRVDAPLDARTLDEHPSLRPAVALPAVSSTAVRASLAAGRSVDGLVPHAVRAEIVARGLYAPVAP